MNNYKKPIVFFVVFLVVLTLPLTIKASLSYFQSERITRDLTVALREHFEESDTQKIFIKNIWIKKQSSFLMGGGGFKYGFDYYSEDQWKKFECRDRENNFTFSMNHRDFSCSTNKNLVYDDVTKRIVEIQNNDMYIDHSVKILIWDDFEKFLLLLYGLIILVADIIITLVWIMIRFIKARKELKRAL